MTFRLDRRLCQCGLRIRLTGLVIKRALDDIRTTSRLTNQDLTRASKRMYEIGSMLIWRSAAQLHGESQIVVKNERQRRRQNKNGGLRG